MKKPTSEFTDKQLMQALRNQQAMVKKMNARIAEFKAELLNRIVATKGTSIETEVGTATFVPLSKYPKWDAKILEGLLADHPAIGAARGESVRRGHLRFKAKKKAKEGGA